MKNIKNLLIFVLILNSNFLLSQTTFSKKIDFANGNEGGYQLVYQNDSYYLGGYGIVFDTIDNKVSRNQYSFLYKIDSNLNIIKGKIFDLPFQLTKMICKNDTLYLFGQDVSHIPFSWRLYKFSPDLDSLDLLVYDNFEDDKTYSTTFQVKDDYFYYGSYSYNGKILFVKSDKNGNAIKKETFSDYTIPWELYIIKDLIQTSDGHFAFGHWHKLDSLHHGEYQIGIIKFDDNLDVIWSKELPFSPVIGSSTAMLPRLTSTMDGGMVVSSGIALRDSIKFKPDKFGEYSYYGVEFQKLDKDGNIVWRDLSYNKKLPGYWYGISPIEYVFKLITAQNGDIIAAGIYAHNFYEPGTKGWICRYSSVGKMKWKHYYVDPEYSGSGIIRDMVEAENGDIICLGDYDRSRAFNDERTWLLRVDSNGCVTPGCECVPDSNTRVWATAEAGKILVNTPNVWYQSASSMTSPDIRSTRYKLSYYLIKNNFAFGVLKSDEETGENWDTTEILLRQIGNKVWMYEDNNDPPDYDYKLLYDFSLVKGDTFRSEIFEDNDIFLLVEETDTITLSDGSKRKRLMLSCNNEPDTVNFSGYGLRTWIEGIGDTRGLLSVAGSCMTDQNTSLLCFHQKGDLLWDNPDRDGCWLSGTKEIVENRFIISPNPAQNKILVKLWEGAELDRWAIYNITGQMVKSGNIKSSETFTINGLKEFESGLYFLQLKDSSGKYGVQKFAIE